MLTEEIGFVQNRPTRENQVRKQRALNRKGKGKKVVRGRNGKVDPLKTFNARGRGKK